MSTTKRNRKWRDHSAMTTGETHWPDILAMFVITENYRDDRDRTYRTGKRVSANYKHPSTAFINYSATSNNK